MTEKTPDQMSPTEQHDADLLTISNHLAYFADELGGSDQVIDTIKRLNEELIRKMPVPVKTCDECEHWQQVAEDDPASYDNDRPTRWWHCQVCDAHLDRWRGQGDQTCDCGAEYNTFGQRLRDDWRENPAWRDGNVDDLTGYEISQLRKEGTL